jgi:hypothetical protein
MTTTRNFKNDIDRVRKFAHDYDIIFINEVYDISPYELNNRYIIIYEWTDGDELTFKILKGHINEYIDEIYDDNNIIVSISLDEYDITTDIIELLYNKCITNNILIN